MPVMKLLRSGLEQRPEYRYTVVLTRYHFLIRASAGRHNLARFRPLGLVLVQIPGDSVCVDETCKDTLC